MSKHTPGPWHHTAHLSSSENHNGYRVCTARWHGVADVFPVDKNGIEGQANASLIAAAPDLLFQLLAASNYIDALGGDSASYRAAIAKATEAA